MSFKKLRLYDIMLVGGSIFSDWVRIMLQKWKHLSCIEHIYIKKALSMLTKLKMIIKLIEVCVFFFSLVWWTFVEKRQLWFIHYGLSIYSEGRLAFMFEKFIGLLDRLGEEDREM